MYRQIIREIIQFQTFVADFSILRNFFDFITPRLIEFIASFRSDSSDLYYCSYCLELSMLIKCEFMKKRGRKELLWNRPDSRMWSQLYIDHRAFTKWIFRTHAQRARGKTRIQLTCDFGSVNLRYVARANGVTDPVIIIIVAAVNTVIVVVALRYRGCVVAITDLAQIAHAHGRRDTGRHHRHVLRRDRKNCVNFDK